jgi:RNA polymerase sigma-70 factor, ECF subfamily
MGPDESFLIARARRGDVRAFEEIVRLHQRRVYGVALRIVRAHDVADDVVQEAFVRAWRALDRFDSGEAVRPLGLPHRGEPRGQPRALAPRARGGLPDSHAEAPGRGPSPPRCVLDEEATAGLDGALDELSAGQRAVFVLRAREEMSYAQIAQTLGISPGTVMSRLFRARERLARALAPYLGGAAPRGKEATP